MRFWSAGYFFSYGVFVLSTLLVSHRVSAQHPFTYIWPIDSPHVITGNYGELRPNHFHAGIDFSTAGKINLPVYCVEEGYISRIRVSPYGYGKCVYITHPNGKVSLYAHLNAFSLKVDKVAKTYQLATQSNEIDYMPSPRSVYVRRNEIIGLSGNSGGSTGPHLHFEIRDELSEIPLNPLTFFTISDITPPELHTLAFYDLSDTLHPEFMQLVKLKRVKGDSLVADDDHLLLAHSLVGLAFSGADRCYPDGNPNNIYEIRLYLEDTLIYMHHLNNIAFSDMRFVNEFSELISKARYQKCFQPTLYPAGFYGKCRNKGRIALSDSVYHKFRLEASDESGNTSRVTFYMKAKQRDIYKRIERGELFVNCNDNFLVTNSRLQLRILSKTLFASANLTVTNTLETNDRLQILPEVNLRQPIRIGFKVPDRYRKHAAQLMLNSAVALSRNDSVFFDVKELGSFRLRLDTISPKVKIDYTERKLKEAWQMDAFSFKITDQASGIGKYNLWLNNAWVIAEYDAKIDLLTYYFDEDTPIGLLQFKLEVEDKAGNKTFFEYVLKK